MKRQIRLFIFVFLLLPALAFASSFSGKVVGISDGDTISVMRDGKAVKVRLAGIDCPERKQPFGTKAKQFTSDMAFAKIVTVEVKDVDRFQRIVGEVILPDGRSLNRELVKVGLAWWYRKYSKDETLGRLEEAARSGKEGLWGDRHPIPPWEFRKQKKKPIGIGKLGAGFSSARTEDPAPKTFPAHQQVHR